MRELTCEYCKNKFYPKNRNHTQRCCSKSCGQKLRIKKGKSLNLFGKNKPSWNKGLNVSGMSGKKHTPETKLKMSLSSKKENPKSTQNALIRKSKEYKEWRKRVFERDNYACQNGCRNKDIHPHHIKSFSEYPELRFNVDNGQTLCSECHGKIHNIDFNAVRRTLRCVTCGKKFKPKKGNYRVKNCSKECGVKYRSSKPNPKKGRKYPHLQRAKIKECPVCGNKFRAINDCYSKKQIYCSHECYLKHRWGFTGKQPTKLNK